MRLEGSVAALNPPRRDAQALTECFDRFRAAMAPAWSLAWRDQGGGVVPISRLSDAEQVELLDSVKALNVLLGGVADRYRLEQSRKGGDRENLAMLDAYRADLDRIANQSEFSSNRNLIYFSPVRNYPGVASIADGAARVIASQLWREPRGKPLAGLLFTSATLSTLAHSAETMPRRALASFINTCGFQADEIEAESCAVIAPDHFGSMEFVRPALDAPSAFTSQTDDEGEGRFELADEAVSYWHRMVLAASEEGGRVLVLLPAHSDVKAMGALFDGDARAVVQFPAMQTSAAVRQFLDREDSIWISASVWEGISLPHAISHIVVPRVPIRPRSFEDSILERYLSELTGKEGAGAVSPSGGGLRQLASGCGRESGAVSERQMIG